MQERRRGDGERIMGGGDWEDVISLGSKSLGVLESSLIPFLWKEKAMPQRNRMRKRVKGEKSRSHPRG